MEDKGGGGYSAALLFCHDKYLWLLEKCRHALRVRRFPNFMSDGEDLAQTICYRFAAMPDEKWVEVKNPEAYLVTTIRNEADQLYRDKKRSRVINLEDFTNLPDRPHHKKLEAALLLKEILKSLPPDRREMLEMAYIDELPRERIAELLGLSPAALRQRLSRTCRDLRDLLSAAEVGLPPPS